MLRLPPAVYGCGGGKILVLDLHCGGDCSHIFFPGSGSVGGN